MGLFFCSKFKFYLISLAGAFIVWFKRQISNNWKSVYLKDRKHFRWYVKLMKGEHIITAKYLDEQISDKITIY